MIHGIGIFQYGTNSRFLPISNFFIVVNIVDLFSVMEDLFSDVIVDFFFDVSADILSDVILDFVLLSL